MECYSFFDILELAFFCMGAIIFHAYQFFNLKTHGAQAGVLMLVFLVFYSTNYARVPVLLGDTIIFSGKLVQFYLLVALSVPFVFSATKSNKIDRFLGELSYPIYIVHVLVIARVSLFPSFSEEKRYNVVIYTLFASVILYFIQFFVEKRFKQSANQLLH